MTKRLILVRHAEVELRYAGRFVGSSDVPLSDLGLRQAAALARSLRKNRVDQLFASPLRRAVQTAEFLQQDIQIDPDLREIDFGRWEGRSFQEISASGQQEQIDRWSSFDPTFSFPEGESLGAFVDRIARAADRLANGPDETVVAITHGGVIRAMICRLLGLSPEKFVLFNAKRASITTVDLFDGRGVLAGLGDVCHLEGID